MANTILDASGLKYVFMQNARFARKPLATLFDGGAWVTLRVALMLKVENTGVNTSNVVFSVGLCSGTTNIPGDATPTNAVGVQDNSANPWIYSAVAPNEKYSSINFKPFKNVAGVNTQGANFATAFSTQFQSSINTNGGAGTPLFVDITKGSPNYSLRIWSCQAATSVVITEAQYITQSINSSPSFTNMTYATAQTIAFSEAGGTLDAAFVAYDQASGIRILDWRVIKLA